MSQHLIKYPFDPEVNKERLLEKYKSSNPEHTENIAHVMLASHATSWKNLLSILKDNNIHSYRKLTKLHPKVVENSNFTTTDVFDVGLGLDNFVFFSMGRGTVSELVDHYLCFKHDIIYTKDALASLIEVAECGAIVSHQAERVYRVLHGFSKDDITQVNEFAKKVFFPELFHAHDLDHILSLFLRKHYRTLGDYTLAEQFPEKILPDYYPFKKLNQDRRQGPQLMVPHKVQLDKDLYGILDVYDTGDIKHNLKGKYSVSADKVARLKEIAKAVKAFQVLKPSLFEKTPAGMQYGLIMVINMVIEEMGRLSAEGYDGKLEEGLIDSFKTTYGE